MSEPQVNPPGRTLRSRGHRGDQEGEGENFDFDNLSGSDEDNVLDRPVRRGRRTQNTATTPSQPVAQEINSVVPAPASKSSQGDVRDVQYFFDKQSAEKPFCKLCKYVFHPLTNSFFSQTKQKKLTGRYEMLTP